METKGAFGRRLCFLIPGETEQLVAGERGIAYFSTSLVQGWMRVAARAT
jgi:hypothetical protein